jgi:hypothetical protein
MRIIAAATMSLLFIGIVSVRGCATIQYNANCGGYLKRAADANTVDRANVELTRAIKYLSDNNMTRGYTSVIYKTPDEDVGYWYNNLVDAQQELDRALANPGMTQLESSNVLMKLRETLTDNGDSGTKVTEPQGIDVFPNNKLWALVTTLALLISVVGWIAVWAEEM